MNSISVVIPCYNASTTIERAVRSVLATGYEPLEIVVVDDASTDGSSEIVEQLAEHFSPTVRLVRHHQNQGPAKTRNTGARTATGELLFFLDSDTEMRPDTLTRFISSIIEADVVIGIYDAEPLNRGTVPVYKALLYNYFFSVRGRIPYEVFDCSRAGIRAEVFRETGGFREDIKRSMDFENEEFGYRICRKYRMVLDPKVMVRHEFPYWWKLTRTYFSRVAYWVEFFVVRRQFESGGVCTAGTGASTLAAPLSMVCLFIGMFSWSSVLRVIAYGAALVLFAFHLYGYAGFFRFVVSRRPAFFPAAVLLNIYFSLVIAAGAVIGFVRSLLGRSEVRARLADVEGL